MHELIIQILRSRSTVLLSCEPCQPLLVHKNAKRVDTRHQDIDAHVEFKPIDQVGLVHVSLNDASVILYLCITRGSTFYIASQVNSAALATGFRLNDECLCLALLSAFVVGKQVLIVVGETPGDGKELILSWKLFSKLHECSSEIIFAGEDGHA